MEAINWFQTVVTKHYVDFQGRARRAEYWWYILVYIVIDIVLTIVQSMLHTTFITALFGLALLLPSLGVSFRRMHDIDKSAWWLLIGLIPLVGAIILIYWFAQPGTSGPNQFGPDPKAGAKA
jgi:uncharacterized membrane protein YhaH (DUF805 family)